MKKLAFAGAAAALLMASAGAAGAAVVPTFTMGPAHSPGAGYKVVDTFDTTANVTGANFHILNGNSGAGAPPANSNPGGNYLSVLTGGSATIAFSHFSSTPVTSFEFDWGSVDTYNHLTINYLDSMGIAQSETLTPGSPAFPLTNGDQSANGSNGLFSIYGNAGESFTSITLTSDQNSFEIDNLAIAVPEPASWALMIVGLGAMGAALRARRKAVLA